MLNGYIRKVITEIKKDWKRFVIEQLLDLFLVISVVLYFQKYVPIYIIIGMIVIYVFYHAYKHVKKIYMEIKAGVHIRNNEGKRK